MHDALKYYILAPLLYKFGVNMFRLLIYICFVRDHAWTYCKLQINKKKYQCTKGTSILIKKSARGSGKSKTCIIAN